MAVEKVLEEPKTIVGNQIQYRHDSTAARDADMPKATIQKVSSKPLCFFSWHVQLCLKGAPMGGLQVSRYGVGSLSSFEKGLTGPAK